MEKTSVPSEARSSMSGRPRLASSLRDLASRQTVDETLQLAVDLSSELVRGCAFADVMFLRAGGVTTPVSTHPIAVALDDAQEQTDGGPCVTAAREQRLVVANDLATDDRWPAFAGRARDLGVRSAVSYQLYLNRNDDDRFGALNLYGEEPHAFDEEAIELGEVFAAQCAATLASAIAHEGAQAALASRDVIGQAKGILMERHQLTASGAFDLLRRTSQQRNMKLRDLAQHVADTGSMPE
jgi:GAF domain-containing protein